MQQFRKIWDAEKNEFIKSTKGMTRTAALQAFRENYPEADCTDVAFFNQRSRLKAADNATYKGSRKPRPLYAEQEKKGYIRIKIAQPNTWVSKAKWVYMQAHPEEDLTERSNYIFLDGDTRNFAPENIARVPLSLMGLFCGLGGTVKGAPECTRINILRARLKKAQLDALEKHGQVSTYAHCRKDKKEVARERREWYKTHREQVLQHAKEKRGTK